MPKAVLYVPDPLGQAKRYARQVIRRMALRAKPDHVRTPAQNAATIARAAAKRQRKNALRLVQQRRILDGQAWSRAAISAIR